MIRYVFNVGLLNPLLLAGLPGALSFYAYLGDRIKKTIPPLAEIVAKAGAN